jgi:CheY-like chemotaxis protein
MTILEGKRIFVVEDDVVNMAVYSVTLKQSGALVIQDPWNANTIKMIIDMLPIDIIILDLMLRYGVSGYDIYDQIRLRPELVHVPVVAVSASDPVNGITKTREKGFSGYISKPININQFPKQIVALLSGEEIWIAT